MSATLSIINNFQTTINGSPIAAHQGSSSITLSDTYDITLTGKGRFLTTQLATATAATVYDDSAADGSPTDFIYLWYMADQTTYIQMIYVSGTQSIKLKLGANIPFSFGGFNSMLATAASATIMASEPSTQDINKVVIGNYSGTTANCIFGVFL